MHAAHGVKIVVEAFLSDSVNTTYDLIVLPVCFCSHARIHICVILLTMLDLYTEKDSRSGENSSHLKHSSVNVFHA